MRRKLLRTFAASFAALVAFQYGYPGSPDGFSESRKLEILAHRGLHQNWKKGTYDRTNGCEASHVYPPTHDFIENTLESIGAAFDRGATIVEIDIHRSSDDHLVVFHDWMLECRTNGTGKVNDHPLEALQKLDIGYGYTHDDGSTFPFRGKGVGRMPTLEQVIEHFPDRNLLIDNKENDQATAELLASFLKNLPVERQQHIFYWGTEQTYALIQSTTPAVKRRLANRKQLKHWYLTYLLSLGFSGFPSEAHGLALVLPADYARFIWGWPYRFLHTVHASGATFYLMVDNEEDAREFQDLPLDGIVTDHIDSVGKYYVTTPSTTRIPPPGTADRSPLLLPPVPGTQRE